MNDVPVFNPPQADPNGDVMFWEPIDFWDHMNIALLRKHPNYYIAPITMKGERINLGAGRKIIDNWHNIDYPDWDAEDQSGNKWRIPFANASVAEIACYFTLDHLHPWAVVRQLTEFQRVLVPGGAATIVVPHYSSQLANECIQHHSRFGIDTWRNIFSERQYDHKADNNGQELKWNLEVGLNMMFGLTERNLCIFTQLVRKTDPPQC